MHQLTGSNLVERSENNGPKRSRVALDYPEGIFWLNGSYREPIIHVAGSLVATGQNYAYAMRYLIVWAFGNLAWMALVYCVTFAYDRFKKRPTNTLVNALGTLLATASALIAVRWWTPFMIHTPPGTFWYYLGVALLAAAGPGMCGIFFFTLASLFDKYDPFDTGCLNQLVLPFYVSFFLFGGLAMLGALLAFLLPSSLIPNR